MAFYLQATALFLMAGVTYCENRIKGRRKLLTEFTCAQGSISYWDSGEIILGKLTIQRNTLSTGFFKVSFPEFLTEDGIQTRVAVDWGKLLDSVYMRLHATYEYDFVPQKEPPPQKKTISSSYLQWEGLVKWRLRFYSLLYNYPYWLYIIFLSGSMIILTLKCN